MASENILWQQWRKSIMKDFSPLEQNLNISFTNKDLLVQAFTHRSYLNENPETSLAHNERLEFLGDAVLELVVTEYLYQEHPDKPEGVLTTWRAALVNAKMLSFIAKSIGFNNYLLLSKGEAKEEGKARDYILANTMEAFLGSLYLDQGLVVSQTFITQHVLSQLPRVISEELFQDAKSRFQELAQEKAGITPTYMVLQEQGPDHAKDFTIGVYLGEEQVAKGIGTSKQEAEQVAAANALLTKNWK